MGKPNKRKKDIIIDYENLDVQDIMDQIKKKIESQPKKSPLKRKVPGGEGSFWGKAEEMEEMEGLKGKIKQLLLRGIRPFSPLIKLLVLPVHQEIREAHRSLHHAHKRLDNLEKMNSNLEQKIKELSTQLNRTQEYVKLLHNLSHNTVVELSKLKIEEENIKIKNRIMEKDLEFLSKREKTLEKKIYS
ncbi:hypothetical protein KGY73_06700 [bacterium]|nr:hypothetical protein [bacterium]